MQTTGLMQIIIRRPNKNTRNEWNFKRFLNLMRPVEEVPLLKLEPSTKLEDLDWDGNGMVRLLVKEVLLDI